MTRSGTVLLLYHRPTQLRFKDAATVREHIHAFARHSRLPVSEFNTDDGFPVELEAVHPAAVLLHYSLFGSGNYRLDVRYLEWMRGRPDMVKVAFFQDEYYFCQKRFAFVNDNAIDLVYTHVSPQHIPAVWGRYAPGTRAIFNLPGYVDDGMLAAAERYACPDGRRDIDVGYRGRPLPAHMGAGSQEKRVIGERFKELAAGTGLRLDIETGEEHRIYGKAWYRFLARSRATLGVESGVSFIDLEDECHAEYLELRAATGREPTLQELQAGALGRWDGNIPYRTLGPRHFEAAAFGVCQVLFEGEYSGAMQPGVHYLPLAQDFSNVPEVVAALKDRERSRRIAERAKEDLIASGRYSYASFVREVDRELIAAGVAGEPAPRARTALSRAVRTGRVRLRVRRRAQRTHALAAYLVWRVVAPISARIRRLLGLPVPTGER
jgi:hypothetical protein